MQQELHIFEEETNLFWGLIILVCTTAGTYLLAGTFVTMDWNLLTFRQIAALILFLISFWGVFRLSEPLYHFIFHFEDNILIIDVRKGSIHVDTHKLSINEIEALKFSPNSPRSKKEALFDFSRSYHLMWKPKDKGNFRRMLSVKSSDFILKVDDIAKIMRFIQNRNPDIHIPPEQARYFNL